MDDIKEIYAQDMSIIYEKLRAIGKPPTEEYRVYSVDFVGHYPVGAVAIVIAKDKQEATTMMERELAAVGLSQNINIKDIQLINHTNKGVTILLDGEY